MTRIFSSSANLPSMPSTLQFISSPVYRSIIRTEKHYKCQSSRHIGEYVLVRLLVSNFLRLFIQSSNCQHEGVYSLAHCQSWIFNKRHHLECRW